MNYSCDSESLFNVLMQNVSCSACCIALYIKAVHLSDELQQAVRSLNSRSQIKTSCSGLARMIVYGFFQINSLWFVQINSQQRLVAAFWQVSILHWTDLTSLLVTITFCSWVAASLLLCTVQTHTTNYTTG